MLPCAATNNSKTCLTSLRLYTLLPRCSVTDDVGRRDWVTQSVSQGQSQLVKPQQTHLNWIKSN